MNNILYQNDIRQKWGSQAGSVIIRWTLATGIETSDSDSGNTFYISFYVDNGLQSFENSPELVNASSAKSVCSCQVTAR